MVTMEVKRCCNEANLPCDSSQRKGNASQCCRLQYPCRRSRRPSSSLLMVFVSAVYLLSFNTIQLCSCSRHNLFAGGGSDRHGNNGRDYGYSGGGSSHSQLRRRINATSIPWMSFLDSAESINVSQEQQHSRAGDGDGGKGGGGGGGCSSSSSDIDRNAQARKNNGEGSMTSLPAAATIPADGNAVGSSSSNNNGNVVGGGRAPGSAAAVGEGEGAGAGIGVSGSSTNGQAGKALSENYYVSHLGQSPPGSGKTPQVTRWIPAVRMSKNGEIEAAEISRSATAADLRCPLRDMRLVDPTFPGQYPKMIARKAAIIMSINCVKAIIKKDEILLFHPDEATTKELVSAMRQQLPAYGVPFEQVAMEACLSEVCQSFRRSVQGVVVPLAKFINNIRFGDSLSINLDGLLPLKNQLGELLSKITETVKALNEVLMSDEDMNLMYLTENRSDVSKHEEIEMMLENYLMQTEMLTKELVDYQTLVRNMEEVLEINLDFQRNRIMKYELLLNCGGLIVTTGALVTGVFGMNLLSGWETRPAIFWLITGMIYSFIFSAFSLTIMKLKRQHII